jgi:hypothetical protein
MQHFKDPETSKVYFSTTRDGKPTKIQRTAFAEIFYCMAMAGLAKATKDAKYKVPHVDCTSGCSVKMSTVGLSSSEMSTSPIRIRYIVKYLCM